MAGQRFMEWKFLAACFRLPRLFARAGTVHAQAPDLFAHKTVTVYIGNTVGGGYDLYGRMVARFLGRHLPGNPNVVAENMPGAGTIRAANFIYSAAAKDGTALGIVTETLALEQALANPAVQYDAVKYTWIGRVASSNNIQMMWHTSKVQSIEDAKLYEAPVAGTGPGNIAEEVPTLLNSGDRHQIQDHLRLSRLERSDAGDGTRRGRRLGLVLGGGEDRQEGLARG